MTVIMVWDCNIFFFPKQCINKHKIQNTEAYGVAGVHAVRADAGADLSSDQTFAGKINQGWRGRCQG